ncbi:MAG: S8 family serine peptidase [Planctomycetota bacterium]
MRNGWTALAASVMALAGSAHGAGERFTLEVPAVTVELAERRVDGEARVRTVSGSTKAVGGRELTVTGRIVVELGEGVRAHELSLAFGMPVLEERTHGGARFVHLDAGSGARALRSVGGLRADARVRSAQVMVAGMYERTSTVANLTDPRFPEQVHLVNTGQLGGNPGVDLNVAPAWDAGWTGSGVTIQVVDDGIQHQHPDLSEFYNPAASFDRAGNDPDPTSEGSVDFHGTPCAGLALGNDDDSAGVGVAFNAGLSAVRQEFSIATPTDLAFAHDYAIGINDVSSNSYGPSDQLLLVAPLSGEQTTAIRNAVNNGRDGKGVVFFVSGGNGKPFGDDANFNGFASSRFTASVTAVDQNGNSPSYAEPGACHLVSAVSEGAGIRVTTTDLVGPAGINGIDSDLDSTNRFGGTSSATPQAAGVAALMLEANPALTWRDVHWILATTARRNDPSDAGWTQNDSGLWFNHQYGFGLIDADAAVRAAETWTNVPEEGFAFGRATFSGPLTIPDAGSVEVEVPILFSQIDTIETAELRVRLVHPHQGDVRIELVSPTGVTSVIGERPNDDGDGYTYTFTSVRHLGDAPDGPWTVRFTDTRAGDEGSVALTEVRFYGHEALVNACSGDFDNDGDVDLGDFGLFGAAFGSFAGDSAYDASSDFDADGDVDLGDFGVFGADFGRFDCL